MISTVIHSQFMQSGGAAHGKGEFTAEINNEFVKWDARAKFHLSLIRICCHLIHTLTLTNKTGRARTIIFGMQHFTFKDLELFIYIFS